MHVVVDVFWLTKPLSEIILRATAAFLALVVLVRLVPKRNAGHISPNDMLVLIVIGGMGADAVMGGTHSVGDILIMIALILALGYVLDLLEHRSPPLRRFLRHNHTPLVDNGRLLRRNMRREMITEEELWAVLRREGIDELSMVKAAAMEADGEISVIKRN